MGDIVMEEKYAVPIHHTTQVKHMHLVIEVNEFRAVNNLQPSREYIVTTSKLPAASTLYTKGMLFAREEQIVAIRGYFLLSN